MEDLIKALPLLISLIVVPGLAFFREKVHQIVPDHLIPVLLPAGAAVLGVIAHFAGVDAALLGQLKTDPANPDLLQTVITATLSGFAATGLHQVKAQLKKKP